MFAKVYQTGETGVEIFSPSGSSDPLKIFQCSQEASSKIEKLYDRATKGYIVKLETESPITKLHCPNKSYSTLHVTQPLLCLQLSVARDKAFSLEVSVLDKNHQRKRFHFSTHFKEKEAAATSPSAKLPWFRSSGCDWMTYVINLCDLCAACFPGFSFHSLDSFTLHPVCQLRKIFSLPLSKRTSVNDVEIPTSFDFPVGIDSQVFLYDPHGPLPLPVSSGHTDEKAMNVIGEGPMGGISIQGKGMASMSSTAVKAAVPTLSQRVRLKLKSRQTPAITVQPPPRESIPQKSEHNEVSAPSTPMMAVAAAETERRDDVIPATSVMHVHSSHSLLDEASPSPSPPPASRASMMSAKSFLHLLTPPQSTEKEVQDDGDVSAYQRQMSDVRASLSSSFSERAREWREEVQRFAHTSEGQSDDDDDDDDDDVRADEEFVERDEDEGFDTVDFAGDNSHSIDVSAVEEVEEADVSKTAAEKEGEGADVSREEDRAEDEVQDEGLEGVNDVRFEELRNSYVGLLDSVMTWSPSEKKRKEHQFFHYLDVLQRLERGFLQNYGREDFEELVGEFVL